MTDNKEPGWTKIRIRQSVDELIKYGPSIEVGIAPLPFEGAGMQSVLAQIDTGAGSTGISARLARELKLKQVGSGIANRPGLAPIRAPFFNVTLFLPSINIEMEVVGLDTLTPPHDILIGRDVLARAKLTVDFIGGVICLHFKNP